MLFDRLENSKKLLRIYCTIIARDLVPIKMKNHKCTECLEYNIYKYFSFFLNKEINRNYFTIFQMCEITSM